MFRSLHDHHQAFVWIKSVHVGIPTMFTITDIKVGQQINWWCCRSYSFTWAAAKRIQRQALLSVMRNMHGIPVYTPVPMFKYSEQFTHTSSKYTMWQRQMLQAQRQLPTGNEICIRLRHNCTQLHIITRQTPQCVLLSNSNHEPRRCPAKCPSDIAQGRRNLTLPHFLRIYRIEYYSSRFSECSFPTELTQWKFCMYLLFLPSDRLAKSIVMTWFRLKNHVKTRTVIF
jgi:hypothetical protein